MEEVFGCKSTLLRIESSHSTFVHTVQLVLGTFLLIDVDHSDFYGGRRRLFF